MLAPNLRRAGSSGGDERYYLVPVVLAYQRICREHFRPFMNTVRKLLYDRINVQQYWMKVFDLHQKYARIYGTF
jgi:hypothetical protein